MNFEMIHNSDQNDIIDFVKSTEAIISSINSGEAGKSIGILKMFKELTPKASLKRFYADYIYGMSKSLEQHEYTYWYISGIHLNAKCSGKAIRHIDGETYDDELPQYALLMGLFNSIPSSEKDTFEQLVNNGPLTVLNKEHPFNQQTLSVPKIAEFLNHYNINSIELIKRFILIIVLNMYVNDVKLRYALFSEFTDEMEELDIFDNIKRFFQYILWIRKNNSFIYYAEYIRTVSSGSQLVLENSFDLGEEDSLDLIEAAIN